MEQMIISKWSAVNMVVGRCFRIPRVRIVLIGNECGKLRKITLMHGQDGIDMIVGGRRMGGRQTEVSYLLNNWSIFVPDSGLIFRDIYKFLDFWVCANACNFPVSPAFVPRQTQSSRVTEGGKRT